ncbi:MAG: hypothetical protein KDA78_16740 [Planctomycetaceae bacterium]|nr:hypothetical protein [Planctomycetaceae bacterium]
MTRAKKEEGNPDSPPDQQEMILQQATRVALIILVCGVVIPFECVTIWLLFASEVTERVAMTGLICAAGCSGVACICAGGVFNRAHGHGPPPPPKSKKQARKEPD